LDARFGRELQNISLKGGFLQEITRTVAGNFGWSEVIAQEALVSEDVPDEIWSALLRGWSTDHTSEEWRSLLATVERIEPVYSSVLYELSLLLNRAVERKEDGLPIDLLDTALARANAGWASCAAYEQPLPEQAENWVTVADNSF